MSIQPGDRIPDAILQCIRDGVQKVDTASLFKGNKLVLFAVPGAFTPTCSERHLPGFVEHFGSFHDKGIGTRSKRFALYAEDGVVRQLFVEAPGEFRVSSAEHVLAELE